MFIILKKGHQPGVYVPLRALFLVCNHYIKHKVFNHILMCLNISSCYIGIGSLKKEIL